MSAIKHEDAVQLRTSGDYKNITKYLRREAKIAKIGAILEEYGKKGVEQLKAATPERSGETAKHWDFDIKLNPSNQTATLEFWNDNYASSPGYRKGRTVPVALLIQYGHGTGTGGYVEAIDYINPVIQPIFEEIMDKVLKEVTKI